MEQRVSLITLGVADLARAVSFYERVVGWKASPSPPEIAFFDLNGVNPHGPKLARPPAQAD